MTDRQIVELKQQLLDLIADQKMAARVELERLLADYLAAADGNMDWYWVDQVQDRIKALAFFPPRGNTRTLPDCACDGPTRIDPNCTIHNVTRA